MPSLKKKNSKKTLFKKKTPGKSIKRKTKRTVKKKGVSCAPVKRKSHKQTLRKQVYKYVEYPDYNNKSELVDKDFRDQVIRGANMKNMNLSGAKLQGTKFVDCFFNNTNFDGAHVDTHTEFINCTFRNVHTENIKYTDGALKEDFEKVFKSSMVSYI